MTVNLTTGLRNLNHSDLYVKPVLTKCVHLCLLTFKRANSLRRSLAVMQLNFLPVDELKWIVYTDDISLWACSITVELYSIPLTEYISACDQNNLFCELVLRWRVDRFRYWYLRVDWCHSAWLWCVFSLLWHQILATDFNRFGFADNVDSGDKWSVQCV